MSRCRQLTVQQLHVVGMELMYEKTFNSSSRSSTLTFSLEKTPETRAAVIMSPLKPPRVVTGMAQQGTSTIL